MKTPLKKVIGATLLTGLFCFVIAMLFLSTTRTKRPLSPFTPLAQAQAWYGENPIPHTAYSKHPTALFFYDPGEPINQQAILEVNKAAQALKSKILFRGIHCAYFDYDHTEIGIKSFIERFKPKFPFVIDSSHSLQNHFNIRKLPTLLLFVPMEKEAHVYSSIPDLSALQAHLLTDIGHQEELSDDLIYQKHQKELDNATNTILRFPTKLLIAQPRDITKKPSLFIADSGNHRILEVSLDGKILQQFGSGQPSFADGNKDIASFYWPSGLAYTDYDHKLYCADRHNHRLRVIDLEAKTVSTCVGDGSWGYETTVSSGQQPLRKSLSIPTDISQFLRPDSIAIAQAGNHEIWIYEALKKRLRPFAGNGKNFLKDGTLPYNGLMAPTCLALHKSTLVMTDQSAHAVRTMPAYNLVTLVGNQSCPHGFADGPASKCRMERPSAICSSDTTLFVTDTNNHAIRTIDTKTQQVSTLCGKGTPGLTTGPLEQSQLHCPQGIAYHDGHLFVADTNNHRIIKIRLADKTSSEFYLHIE